jgi:hypothetical protein
MATRGMIAQARIVSAAMNHAALLKLIVIRTLSLRVRHHLARDVPTPCPAGGKDAVKRIAFSHSRAAFATFQRHDSL